MAMQVATHEHFDLLPVEPVETLEQEEAEDEVVRLDHVEPEQEQVNQECNMDDCRIY